jgi:heme/copper-type cytochrome/quinol oxidase subunit 2
MKKIIIIVVLILFAMEGLGWLAYRKSKSDAGSENQQAKESLQQPIQKKEPEVLPEKIDADQKKDSINQAADSGNFDLASFPPPATETVDGIVQRTIHMGVRKWAWDPTNITANYGEKVILVMHNADVKHSISIPELGVNQEIPEEGAAVIFMASKRGTFEFSCSTPCGLGHDKMRGKITIN